MNGRRFILAIVALVLVLGCGSWREAGPPLSPDDLASPAEITTSDQANAWLARAQMIRATARDVLARLHVEDPENYPIETVDLFERYDRQFRRAYATLRELADSGKIDEWRARADDALRPLRSAWITAHHGKAGSL